MGAKGGLVHQGGDRHGEAVYSSILGERSEAAEKAGVGGVGPMARRPAGFEGCRYRGRNRALGGKLGPGRLLRRKILKAKNIIDLLNWILRGEYFLEPDQNA